MRFSQFAGVAIVPTLSRIVLGIAFVTAGANKLFNTSIYTHEEATQLKSMGVDVTPIESAAGPVVMTVAFQAPTGDLVEKTGEPTQPLEPPVTNPPESVEAAEEAVETAAEAVSDAAEPEMPIEPLPAGDYEARGMYNIALVLADGGIPLNYCKLGARLATWTEFICGMLIFIGFISRLWALALATVMGGAVYFASFADGGLFTMSPFQFATEPLRYNILFRQIAMGVLALGVFLTGPGPLSLDRAFFGRRDEKTDEAES